MWGTTNDRASKQQTHALKIKDVLRFIGNFQFEILFQSLPDSCVFLIQTWLQTSQHPTTSTGRQVLKSWLGVGNKGGGYTLVANTTFANGRCILEWTIELVVCCLISFWHDIGQHFYISMYIYLYITCNINIIYNIIHHLYTVYQYICMCILHIHQITICHKLGHISQGSIAWGGYMIYPNKIRLVGHEAFRFSELDWFYPLWTWV